MHVVVGRANTTIRPGGLGGEIGRAPPQFATQKERGEGFTYSLVVWCLIPDYSRD